jgi:glycosyltransferase involved in cell wall biosynthesis
MIPLDYRWYSNPATGYGRMGDQMADALRRVGVEFTHEADVRVIATNITGIDGFWSHQKRVVWTMWEADTLPEAYDGVFDDIDLVLVPCDANVEAFSRVHKHVEKLRLGLDRRWMLEPRPDEGPFTFLAGGRGWERKGLDATVEAFCDVADDDCQLLLRVEGKVPNHPLLADPRVKLIGKTDTPQELMRKAHVFVSAARGEGFGLMPLEAMAQGCPTILTAAHGHMEFAKYGHPIGCTKTRAGFVGLGDPGMWWEPNRDELRDAIRTHIDHYDSYRQVAVNAAPKIQTEFQWDPHRLLDLVGESNIHTGTTGMVWEDHRSPHVHEIRVKHRVRCEIGGTQIVMEPGETYLHRWDVKRVLHDADALVPECWDPNSVKAVLV